MQSYYHSKALKSSFNYEATNKHDILMIKKSKRVWFSIKGGLDKYDHRNSDTKVWVKCKDKLFPQTGFFCMHFGWLHEGLCVDLWKGLSKPWYFDMKFNSYEIISIWNLIRIMIKIGLEDGSFPICKFNMSLFRFFLDE